MLYNMKRKPNFLLVCALFIAILGIRSAKGYDEEESSVEANEENDKNIIPEDEKGSSVESEEKPATKDKDDQDISKSYEVYEEIYYRGMKNKDTLGFFFKYDEILKCKYDKEMANVKPSNETRNEEECQNGYLLDLKIDKLFKVIDSLEGQYEKVRREYHEAAKAAKLNSIMLEAFCGSRGVGERALHQAGGKPFQVPAGLQVGSYLVLSDEVALYFIHRMKVRNNTVFRVEKLSNNLFDMALHMTLDLDDLHITGSYEQLYGDKTHHEFSYKPTFGKIAIVFSKVKYTMQASYRLVQNRLYIERIASSFHPKDIAVHLGNAGKNPVKLLNLDEITKRITVHLNHWLKDYFNDFLMFFDVAQKNQNAKIQEYDQKKAKTLNEWMDQAITILKAKIRHTDSTALHLKVFPMKIFAPDGMTIDVGPMVLRGIDSLHRRSFTTITQKLKDRAERQVFAGLGFGQLKVEGNYTILIRSGHLPLAATFAITLDGLATSIAVGAWRDKKFASLNFRAQEPIRTEFTTVEGSSTRHLAAYKHILETYLIPIAVDRTMHLIGKLGDYAKCHIFTDYHQIRHIDPGQILEGGTASVETVDDQGLLYAIKRKDSIEVEVPGKKGKPPKKLHIKFNENLDIENAKRQNRRKK